MFEDIRQEILRAMKLEAIVDAATWKKLVLETYVQEDKNFVFLNAVAKEGGLSSGVENLLSWMAVSSTSESQGPCSACSSMRCGRVVGAWREALSDAKSTG